MAAIHPLRNNLSGLAITVVGSFLVLSSVVLINKLAEPPEKTLRDKRTTFQVQQPEQPKQQKIVKQEPPPQKSEPRQAPPNPLKGLDSAVGSIDVGIPSVNMDDLAGADDDLLGQARDVVMTSDSVDEPPQVARANQLEYPRQARAEGVEGYVLLSILVGPDGQVERVKVLESRPGGVFEQVAVQGVRNWKFSPGTYKGQTVKSWVRQRISFDLS